MTALLKMDTNCTTLSLIPTVTGNMVFYYARTTIRSPRKLYHSLTLLTTN